MKIHFYKRRIHDKIYISSFQIQIDSKIVLSMKIYCLFAKIIFHVYIKHEISLFTNKLLQSEIKNQST